MSDETDDAVDQDEMANEWAAAMDEQGEAESDTKSKSEEVEQLKVSSVSPSAEKVGDVKIDVILDIPVTISMEIGRTKLSIRNLLQLNQGSVVELDRFAGEPMDVLVNGTLVAHGEVVVVNEKFGIRLTDVISPADRIKNLR